jgi:hypothetical protein
MLPAQSYVDVGKRIRDPVDEVQSQIQRYSLNVNNGNPWNGGIFDFSKQTTLWVREYAGINKDAFVPTIDVDERIECQQMHLWRKRVFVRSIETNAAFNLWRWIARLYYDGIHRYLCAIIAQVVQQ